MKSPALTLVTLALAVIFAARFSFQSAISAVIRSRNPSAWTFPESSNRLSCDCLTILAEI